MAVSYLLLLANSADYRMLLLLKLSLPVFQGRQWLKLKIKNLKLLNPVA